MGYEYFVSQVHTLPYHHVEALLISQIRSKIGNLPIGYPEINSLERHFSVLGRPMGFQMIDETRNNKRRVYKND